MQRVWIRCRVRTVGLVSSWWCLIAGERESEAKADSGRVEKGGGTRGQSSRNAVDVCCAAASRWISFPFL